MPLSNWYPIPMPAGGAHHPWRSSPRRTQQEAAFWLHQQYFQEKERWRAGRWWVSCMVGHIGSKRWVVVTHFLRIRLFRKWLECVEVSIVFINMDSFSDTPKTQKVSESAPVLSPSAHSNLAITVVSVMVLVQITMCVAVNPITMM